ncbi:MAG: RDD family protein [Bacteroidia bacterium]|nr:RDD family protein [Bacteroidia bacterium]
MTHQERLTWCATCSNRKFDPNRGVICGLTMNYPTFEGTCVSYAEGTPQSITPGSSYEPPRIKERPRVIPVSAGTRFINWIIDRLAIIGLGVVVGAFIGYTGIGYELIQNESRIVDYIFGAVISVFYYGLVESTTGRTIGKLITGTVVVMEDGSKPNTGVYWTRTFCRLIPFNAFSFLGEGIGWHDTLSKTRVVHKDSVNFHDQGEEILDRF